MLTYWDTWYLSAIFIIVAVIMHTCDAMKMRKTANALNGTIRDGGGLELVRGAINLGMILAVLYIAMYVVMILMLICFVAARRMSLTTACAHFFVFGVGTIPFGLITKSFEKPIKRLHVEADNSRIAEKYEEFLVQWQEPRLKLPD